MENVFNIDNNNKCVFLNSKLAY